MLRKLLGTIFGLKRAVLGGPRAPARAAPSTDPRAQDPWVASLLATLGERYQLGEDKPDGAQVLRRTGRARFNPMMVFLLVPERTVVGFYEVRGHGESPESDARGLLEQRIDGPLKERGLALAQERVEDWGGTVLIRRYQGRCDDAQAAAGAVRFICQETDQVMDTAAE